MAPSKLSSELGRRDKRGDAHHCPECTGAHRHGSPVHGALVLSGDFLSFFSCQSPLLPTSVMHQVKAQYLSGALQCAQRCGVTQTLSVTGPSGGLQSGWNCMLTHTTRGRTNVRGFLGEPVGGGLGSPHARKQVEKGDVHPWSAAELWVHHCPSWGLTFPICKPEG